MDNDADIFTALTGNAGLAALVSTRIFPGICPPGTAVPYVIYQKIASDPAAVHEGASEIAHDLYQFSCFATTFAGARAVRTALRTALDGVALASGDVPGLAGERDGHEPAVDQFRADIDFMI